jgi:hypothetical protein
MAQHKASMETQHSAIAKPPKYPQMSFVCIKFSTVRLFILIVPQFICCRVFWYNAFNALRSSSSQFSRISFGPRWYMEPSNLIYRSSRPTQCPFYFSNGITYPSHSRVVLNPKWWRRGRPFSIVTK